ncbi:Anaphase-promoting complex subunit [Thalictrum thalictroides]|uniref:Anaphase-promoting complex subunit n=1 Tax=Thalictrum thalictroides TaxID=46969 RepID=A0A7J6VLX6_THATH|nr:Anaphase-promoting complex subunit [Thalictrum thalictroides]
MAMATNPASSNHYNLGILDSISDSTIEGILESWIGFCTTTESLLKGEDNLSVRFDFVSYVHILWESRLSSLVQDHFLKTLEETFEKHLARIFWCHFDPQGDGLLPKWNTYHDKEDWGQDALSEALEKICLEKQYQDKCLLLLVNALQSYRESMPKDKHNSDAEMASLMCRYRSMVCSVIMTILPRHFSVALFWITNSFQSIPTFSTISD